MGEVMDPGRWSRVEALFDELADLPAADREARLAAAAAGPDGTALVAEVRAMLDADRAIAEDPTRSRFMEATVQGASTLVAEDDSRARPGRSFGKYTLLERIGEGGFGLIHKGWDPVLERPVAIKTCPAADRDLRKRFFREAQIAARLQHPNIVTIYDFGVEDGIPYLVQELLAGDDLDRLIAARQPETAAERIDLLRQIARGLSYAHRQGVLHRDIKPGNIRVLPNGRAKILDFGIARLVDDAAGATRAALTLQDSTMGTVGYLAPEQLSGGDVDRRADLFAFGVVAYELLTGRRPFEGETFQQTSYRLLFERHRPVVETVPECPAVLARLIDRCLAKKPGDRPADFEQALIDLEAAARPTAVTAATRRRRRRLVAITAGLGAAALAVGLQMGARPGDEEGRTAPRLTPVARGDFPDEPPPPPPAETETDEPPSEPAPETGTDPATSDDGAAATGEAEETRRPPARPGAHAREADEAPQTAPAADPRPREDAGADSGPEADGPEREDRDTAAPPRMLQPGPGVVPPEILDKPQPEYPTRAWRRRIEADLVVAVLVDEQGAVRHAVVKNDPVPGYDFGRAALDAARRATFEPAREDGVAGRMWVDLTYTFRRD